MIKRDTKYLGFERGNMYMICMILDAEKIVKEVPLTKCKKKKKISLYDVAQQCFHAQALNVRASLSIETLMSFLMII